LPTQDLVERLLAHRTLGSAPREQLEWLAAHGELRRVAEGEEYFAAGDPGRSLDIVLEGRLTIRVDRGSGPRPVMEWNAGDVTGILPYSRMTASPGGARADVPTEVLSVPVRHFPEMIARCHDVTARLVHVMLDRARVFTRVQLHDEKLVSLGRLAAGLAHELNNPASALVRHSAELAASLLELEESAFALGAAGLAPAQAAAIGHIRAGTDDARDRFGRTPLERADRDDAVAAWLSRHGLPAGLAGAIAESPLTLDSLDRIAETLAAGLLEPALRSLAAAERTRRLTSDIEAATGRIHALVAAVRGFTHVDQSGVPSTVAIGKGLADTVAVLRSKAKQKPVSVTVDIEPGLPPVEGFGGELNQVWANLIDNAIDAAPPDGHVSVTAERRDGAVVVRVVDDGPGVPEALAEQVFEPFFTTKPVGEGTGLGLDIVRRLVRQHRGQVELESRPGRTEFRVVLPRG
jgi:signal transduction histidine kinase